MDRIDDVPGDGFDSGNVKRSLSWSKWFDQIVNALFRPQMTEFVIFPLTADGASSTFTFQFPANTVETGDFPILSSPTPPSGTAFSVHTATSDRVIVVFHNYSGGPMAYGFPTLFSVTVLKR